MSDSPAIRFARGPGWLGDASGLIILSRVSQTRLTSLNFGRGGKVSEIHISVIQL